MTAADRREWPWPDSRLERRTRIAHVYRDALHDYAPDEAKRIDELMRIFKQNWIVDAAHTDPDETLTVAELAQHFDVRTSCIYNWLRAADIKPVDQPLSTKRGYRQRFRLADVEAHKHTLGKTHE